MTGVDLTRINGEDAHTALRRNHAHHLSHGRLRKKVWEGQYFVTHLLCRDEIRAMR